MKLTVLTLFPELLTGYFENSIMARAVEKGLILADASLKESEIDNLLFLPGFSKKYTRNLQAHPICPGKSRQKS